MKNKTFNAKGFTLIEMLVVLMIIGILAAIAVPRFLRKAEIARWSESVAIARSIVDAENRRCSSGIAPTATNGALDVEIPTMRYFNNAIVAAAGTCANGLWNTDAQITFMRGGTDVYGAQNGTTVGFGVSASGGLCMNAALGSVAAWVEDNLGLPNC